MPTYINPKSVDVVPGGGGEGVIAILLGAAGIIGIAVFIIAHALVLVLGLVGIGAILAVETAVLYKRFTRVSWTPLADWYIGIARDAQQARLAGESRPAVEAQAAPAARPAIEAPRPKTIPGVVIRDDEISNIAVALPVAIVRRIMAGRKDRIDAA